MIFRYLDIFVFQIRDGVALITFMAKLEKEVIIKISKFKSFIYSPYKNAIKIWYRINIVLYTINKQKYIISS